MVISNIIFLYKVTKLVIFPRKNKYFFNALIGNDKRKKQPVAKTNYPFTL